MWWSLGLEENRSFQWRVTMQSCIISTKMHYKSINQSINPSIHPSISQLNCDAPSKRITFEIDSSDRLLGRPIVLLGTIRHHPTFDQASLSPPQPPKLQKSLQTRSNLCEYYQDSTTCVFNSTICCCFVKIKSIQVAILHAARIWSSFPCRSQVPELPELEISSCENKHFVSTRLESA